MKKFFLVVLISLVGFASLSAQGMYDLFGYGRNATGGGNATPILVDTEQELIDALSGSKSNRVVIITDNITVSTQFTSKGSNITLLALPGKCLISNGQSSSASGILNMRGNNIIIRNVTFIGPGAYDCDGKDLLQFEDATNAWVDHCDFQDGCDGNFDIKSDADNITITWCRFRYLKPAKSGGSGGSADHRFTNLLGHSSSAKPADGTYNVTYAHNWWDNGCKERMVRCRNCEIHFFNCYWNSNVANYYVGPENAKCYFEGCTFAGKANSKDKIFKSYGGTNACKFVNSVGNLPSNQGTVNNPSYRYFIESASDAVANITDPNCGAGATLVVETDGTIQTCGATLNKYVVTFNLNGKGTNFTQEVYENRTITAPAAPATTGFVFDGWYTNQACTSAFDFSTPITANTTLYAKWVQALTITFNLNGHGDSFTQEVESGAKASVPSTPVSAGYIFVGWYSDQACTNEYDFNTPVASAKTIYAKWEESNNCYEFILATTGTAPSVGDVILGTGVGGTMTMIGGTIEYSSNGLAFKSSGSSKVSVTLLTEMQVGTVITLNMYNGTTGERGLKLADGTGDVIDTYTQDGVGDFSASYTVTAGDGLEGTSTFQIHRSNNSFLKSITVSNCGGSSCSNPELAYAATSIAKTDQDASFTNTLTNPHGLAVTYSSSNTNVATIASNGEVTIKGAGSTIITASTVAQGEYCAATVTYTLTVSATGGAAYPIDESDFPNPERGFYEHAEWSHASRGDYSDNLWDSYFTDAAAAKRSLLLRIYYLDTDELRQNKQLPNGFITMFNNDMQKIRSNGMKCILRFAYDKKSDDGFQDASPATWETHLAQLKPLLQANADVIYVVQAGFLGVWGEWYYSSLGTGDEIEWSDRQDLIDQLLDAVPANRYVQLRTPLFKKKYLGNNNPLTSAAAYHGSDQARLGHHNDAFLNGEENQGTYENRTADMAYIAQECLYVPIGGETNLDDGESSTYNTWCKGSIAEAEMAQLHYSYLNHSYSQYVTNQWKTEGAYARISRNMGYRFQLLSASFDDQVVAGTSMNVQLNIKNVGYAPLYNERYAYIVLKNSTNTYSIPLSSDPRTWAPNDATTAINEYVTLPATMAPGTYDLYLYLPDVSASIANNPKYAVRFANQGIWQASTGYNILNKQVEVTTAACSGANGTGSTFTAPGKTYMQNASAESMSITGVTASNGGTLTYQWYKTTSDIAHGEVIDGATESTYTPSTAEAHDTWYYYCVVTEMGCPVVYTTALSGAIVVNAATYTVTYNTNGADSATPTQEAVTEGTTIVLAAPASKANSIFVGWLCDVDASVYKAGDAYTVTAANTTFTAQWQELGEGCFVVNNTTLGSSTTLADGTQVVLDNCNADANGLSIGGNMLFTAPAGQYFETFTFTATCGSDGKNNYYKINGGSQQTLASSTKTEQTYTITIPSGTNVSIIQIIKSGTTPKVTQICYTFKTGVVIPTYTVSYDANGGTCATTSENAASVALPTSTRDGYTFNGWYTAATGGTLVGAAGDSYAPSANITLYAQWTEVSSGGEVYYFIPYSANVSDGALVSGADGTKGIYKYDGSILAANTEISATNTTSSAGFYYNSTSLEYSEFTKLSNYGTGSTSSRTMRGIKLASGKTIEINLNSKLFSQIDVIYSCASTDEKSIIIAGETCTTTDKDVHIKTITGNFSGTIKIENSSGKEYYLFIVLKEATCTDPALAYTTTTVDKSITDGKFTNPLTNSNSVTVTYSSDNTAVATVNETTGEVTIVGGGTATITASSATQTISSVEYCADEASYTLTVDDSGLLTPTFVWTYHSEMATGGAYPISVSSDGGDVTLSITTTVAGVDLTSTSGNPATGTIAVSTCPSVLTIIVQATSPSTATHRAHTEQKTINITLCQKVYNIPMSSTVYKDNGSSVNPRYVCEVDGVGMLLKKLGTSTYSFSSETNDVFTECVTEKPFLVGTYLDNIFKIELYVNCGTKEKGVTVARRDSYSSSEGDYESITPTITYYTGGTVSEYMPKGAMGKVEILFDTPLNAGECVYIVCGASTKVYGAKLYRAEGDIETSVAFAGVGTINKFAGDEPFIQTATQTTEGIQSSGLITYSSSDKTVAIVDKNTGEVTPLSEGRTRIIATLTASGCYKSSSAEYTLIVKPCTDPECTIAVTEGAAKKCEGQTVTLTATAAEGATFQWYKDSALIAGETNASIVINDHGYYYVEARKVCMQSSNTIRVINLSDPTVTALYDYYYIKQGRETPDLPLFKLENTSTYTVSYTPAGCSYELRDDDILYLVGTPGAIGDGTQTLTVTAENTCGGADASASMTLYTLAATTKPSIAWIGCGDKGQTLPGSIEASQSTEQALYEYLETYFTLTPVNAYCTIDTKELRQYYSQFDLILLTDYPNSHECPGDVDKKDENSYSNAIGCLIDEKPILSFEAFVAGLPNWGINTTPGPDDPDQQTITLLCAAHNIFNNTLPVDETIEFVTSSGLQGFSGLEAPSGMIYIATIPDGSGGTRITCCERQTVIEARMMIMGLNNKAMGSVTEEGKTIIKQIIEYLLQIKNIADCALVFDNKDGDHKWSNPKNWYPAYNAVPKPFQAVRIEQDCQVDNTAAHCSSIRLVKGQKENSVGELTNYDAKLTILPNGGLTVTGFIKEVHDANFMTTYAIAPEDLIIQADKNSNGTLVYGDEEQDLQATVEYYSSAYGAGTANPVWQYMGIPIINRPTAISQYHYSWMCSWENIGNISSNWVWVENEDKVVPFKGYCITQAEEKKFEHKGTLSQPTKTSLSMAYFTSMDGDGFNMFANSWVAPIDITKMEVADFGGAAEATIFIYNTGSRAQYEADGTTPSTDGTNTGAGQYNAIPVAASSYMAGALTKIPTMQGFFIKATKAGTLTLDYDRLCFNTSTFETTAEKMRAPQRVQDEDTTTEDVQPIVPQVMRLDVNSNTWGDRLYILTHNEFSDAFNMGWDGSKQMGDEVAPMLALSAPTGLLAVAAIDDANGRYLTFRAGKDSTYTFSFEYDSEQPLYLYDQLAQKSTEIKTGNTYTFAATNNTPLQRFLISDTPYEVPTSITLVETENSLHFENYGNQLVNVRIVDMQGRVVYTSNTTDEIVDIQPSLPLGVYLAHITMGNDSKVVRLIGKETK